MRKILPILLCFFVCLGLLSAQSGLWEGTITQDGIEYTIELSIDKDGKTITGLTSVAIGDSIYGGKLYGEIHKDRSMNLWDHIPRPKIYPDALPFTMRRRYQLVYKRSIYGDTLKGYWQQVHKNVNDPYKKGYIELRRVKKKTKA